MSLPASSADSPPDQTVTDQSADPHHTNRPSRRGWMLIISGATSILLISAAFLLPVPFVKMAPGPTFNVIGDRDGLPVIDISGTETFPVTGDLDMTTVLESGGPRGGLSFVDAITSWLDPTDAVVPRELLFPDDVTGDEVRQRQAYLFSTSESNAVAAAMDYLNLPVSTRVVVDAVYSDTPAFGQFETRDEIVAIDGTEVTAPSDVVDAVRSAPAGTALDFTVLRAPADVDGAETDQSPPKEQVLTVTSEDNPDAPGTPYIGIGVSTLYGAEFPIDFTLEDVGGPSAGLIFATGIVDKLTPGNLTEGEHVAGTGTITPDGQVGPIGGIRQKLAGAREAGASLFLMPQAHCAEAQGHVPDGLTVAPVATLQGAISALEAFTSGGDVPSCPVASS